MYEEYLKQLEEAEGDSFTLGLIIDKASQDAQLDDLDFNLLCNDARYLGYGRC